MRSKSAVWGYTNALRMDVRDQAIQVLGLHVGMLDTDMTRGIDAKKSDPRDVVAVTFDGLENGDEEVLADHKAQEVRSTLSSARPFCFAPVFADCDPDLRGIFTPERVTIERSDGEIVAERTSPREAFASQGPDAHWDDLHVLYFAGYAMWNYLTAPYLLTLPGVVVEELEPWNEAGQDWRRLRATFPDTIATPAREQTFHYDAAGLLRRHDYAAEVLGSPPAAHLSERHETVSGLVFPTHRYVLPLAKDGRVLPEPTLIAIDLAEILVV